MNSPEIQELLDKLSYPHIAREWFLELDLPGGPSYLSTALGRIEIDGISWRGVQDPFSGRLVSIEGIEESRFGQASAIRISLSGANLEFTRSVYKDRQKIEGRTAKLNFVTFNYETGEIVIPLRRYFTGYMSAPGFGPFGIGTRIVSLTLESQWSGKNFVIRQRWSAAGQRLRRLVPVDKGLDFVGVDSIEDFQ